MRKFLKATSAWYTISKCAKLKVVTIVWEYLIKKIFVVSFFSKIKMGRKIWSFFMGINFNESIIPLNTNDMYHDCGCVFGQN